MENKNHWYDGWFYDRVIAPNQDRMFSEIKKIIKPNSSVLDVGCGTGRFSFKIADSVNQVLGIDLSLKNITTAGNKLKSNPDDKISFSHTTVTELLRGNYHFDYAVMTYVIHEVNPSERVELLSQILQVADNVIIGDYFVPVKSGFWNFLNEIVEFLAGQEHYQNYKHFIANNGLVGLASETSSKIINQINNSPVTSQILVLTK